MASRSVSFGGFFSAQVIARSNSCGCAASAATIHSPGLFATPDSATSPTARSNDSSRGVPVLRPAGQHFLPGFGGRISGLEREREHLAAARFHFLTPGHEVAPAPPFAQAIS